MAHGGARKGAGRKPSSLTVRTREIAEKAIDGGRTTPLEVMIGMLNGTIPFDDNMLKVAVSAAPYIHPKLSSVEQSGKDGGPIETRTSIEVSFVTASDEADDEDPVSREAAMPVQAVQI